MSVRVSLGGASGIILAVLRVSGRKSHPNNRRHHGLTAEPISFFSAKVGRRSRARTRATEQGPVSRPQRWHFTSCLIRFILQSAQPTHPGRLRCVPYCCPAILVPATPLPLPLCARTPLSVALRPSTASAAVLRAITAMLLVPPPAIPNDRCWCLAPMVRHRFSPHKGASVVDDSSCTGHARPLLSISAVRTPSATASLLAAGLLLATIFWSLSPAEPVIGRPTLRILGRGTTWRSVGRIR